jgi:hypothetical protein
MTDLLAGSNPARSTKTFNLAFHRTAVATFVRIPNLLQSLPVRAHFQAE